MSSPAGRRYALLIGVGTFLDDRITDLPSAVSAAEALAEALEAADLGGFEVERLLDPTQRDLQVSIARLCDRAGREDVVVIYYSGHGIKNLNGHLFLPGRDTELEVVDATAVSTAFVVGRLDACRSTSKVLILDASFTGAALRGISAPDHLMILTSSDALDYTFEDADSTGPVFTEALVEGIRSGNADLDGDGIVTFEELFSYGRTVTSSRFEHQRPRLLNLTDRPIIASRSPQHVFLSYGRGDQEFVRWLATELQRMGHKVWIDERGIAGGDQWRDSIASAIDAAKVVLLVMTDEGLSSTWVRREIEYADQVGRPIVPITLQPTNPPPWFTLAFSRLQRLDFTVEGSRADALGELDQAIERSVKAARAAAQATGFKE